MSDNMMHYKFTDPIEAKAMIIANADKPLIKLHTYAAWQRNIDKPFKSDPQFSMHIRCDADALCDAIDQAINSKETYEDYDFIRDTWTYTYGVAVSDNCLFLHIKCALDDKEARHDLTSEE